MDGIYFALGVLLLLLGVIGLIFGKLPKTAGRKIPALLAISGIILIITAGITAPDPQEAMEQQRAEQQRIEAQQQQIEVKTEAQDMINSKGQQKVVVYVKNNSDKIFSGSVEVRSLDTDGSQLGWDVVYPKDLEPARQTYAILWLKTWPTGSIKYKVDGSFK